MDVRSWSTSETGSNYDGTSDASNLSLTCQTKLFALRRDLKLVSLTFEKYLPCDKSHLNHFEQFKTIKNVLSVCLKIGGFNFFRGNFDEQRNHLERRMGSTKFVLGWNVIKWWRQDNHQRKLVSEFFKVGLDCFPYLCNFFNFWNHLLLQVGPRNVSL